jgi:hypothetical protein
MHKNMNFYFANVCGDYGRSQKLLTGLLGTWQLFKNFERLHVHLQLAS